MADAPMTLLQRAGQAWKLNAMFVALLVAAALMVIGWWTRHSPGPGSAMLLMSGVFVAFSALALACFSIQCPECGARWLWNAMRTRTSGGWLAWLESRDACPDCGAFSAGHAQQQRRPE